MNRRLQFLVVGAQKSGTTALATYLRKNPQLFIPDQKEIHYFDNEHLDWDDTDLSVLHRNFAKAKQSQIWGEATPISMYWDTAPKRIWQYNPDMRLIVVLRNPIDRAYSHWAMEHSRGNDPLNFEEALTLEDKRCRAALPLQHRVFSYVDRGFYSCQLRRLWRFFGHKAVLVLRHEELLQHPGKCLTSIWKHIGVDPPGEPISQVIIHKGVYKNQMSPKAHHQLRKIFWQEICQLESLLGWDCSEWLQKK